MRLNILQITPQIPYPLNHGGRISIHGITKSLSNRGHQINLVSYTDLSDNSSSDQHLKNLCNPFFLNVNTSNNVYEALKNLFSPVPYNISKFIKNDLEIFLRDFLRKNKVDIIHIDYLHMGWIIDMIKDLCDIPMVLRQHDLHFRLMQRFYSNEKNYFIKYYAYLQYRKFLTFEPDLCKKFDKCIMITKSDEKELLSLDPSINTEVISIGVEETLLRIPNNTKIPFSMFHLGPLDWLPNKDGLEWFLNEVFPVVLGKIPEAQLYVYSKGSDQIRIDKSLMNNVILKGYVNDIWEEIADKELLLVPLRIGSGIRVKIIEMLASGTSVISTSVGKEGIEAIDEQHLLVADQPNEFASKIVSFFKNEYDKKLMISNARELISNKYTWSKIGEDFEKVYFNLINTEN